MLRRQQTQCTATQRLSQPVRLYAHRHAVLRRCRSPDVSRIVALVDVHCPYPHPRGNEPLVLHAATVNHTHTPLITQSSLRGRSK